MTMTLKQKLAGLIPLALLLGCSNPADNVPGATVSSSTNAPAPAAAAGARTFAFGTNASRIDFVGSKVTGSHNGGFASFSGEFQVVNGKIADSGNKVVIETGSIWTDNGRLTSHLKSPDFFDSAQYPTALFTTTSVQQKDGDATVTGNLTLHGITKQISFPAKVTVTDSAVDVSAEFFLNRFDFNMKYAGKADDLIRKEVVLKLKIKATPGKAGLASL